MRVEKSITPTTWSDEVWLKDFLANQLLRGRLSLVLGAGVSAGIGLPSWPKLVELLFAEKGLIPPSSLTTELASEELLRTQYSSDNVAFASAIRKCLYVELNKNPVNLESSKLLAALGAMVMASSRGRVSNVVSFNFDDLLEEYLSSRGFAVRSVSSLPCWSDYGDVTVLHPHGLLCHDEAISVTRGVVFTTKDFANIVGKEPDLWKQKVTDIFRSSTCIFLGLSGNDMNLTGMLQVAKESHCSFPNAYWGVRLTKQNDVMGGFWEDRGVYNLELKSHEDAPAWLFDICKRAADLRNKST